MRKRTKFLWTIGIPLIKFWINLKYDVDVIGEFPEPPYLLLSNHSQNIDPFFLLAKTSQPVSFVINNAAFQNPFIGLVLRWIDSIPTQKSSKDAKTVLKIFRWIKEGRIVGIFPEGHATWSGETQEAVGGTGKLLDRIKIPIVTVTIKGGYLVNPRWAVKRRKGKIELHVKVHNNSSALDSLNHSDWEWQKETGNLYKGKKKALGAEKILWFCPECGIYRGIKTSGDKIFCKNCDFEKNVYDNGKIGDQNITQILEKQEELLKEYLEKKKHHKFQDCRLRIWQKGHSVRVKNEKGVLTINEDKLLFNNEKFEFSKISGLNTYVSRIVEFIYNDEQLVRIQTKSDSLLIKKILNFMGVA